MNSKILLASFISFLGFADIQVRGEGLIEIIPNKAELSFSIITKDKNSKNAADKNSQTSNKIMNLIFDKFKFNKDNIKTSNYSLRPIYTYIHNQPPKFEGVEVQNDINIREIEIDDAPKLLNFLTTENISEIRNIGFYHNKPEQFVAKSFISAMADAKKKAQLLADEAGLKLVKIKNITEETVNMNGPSPVMFKAHAEMSHQALMPGKVEINKSLLVEFETK